MLTQGLSLYLELHLTMERGIFSEFILVQNNQFVRTSKSLSNIPWITMDEDHFFLIIIGDFKLVENDIQCAQALSLLQYNVHLLRTTCLLRKIWYCFLYDSLFVLSKVAFKQFLSFCTFNCSHLIYFLGLLTGIHPEELPLEWDGESTIGFYSIYLSF